MKELNLCGMHHHYNPLSMSDNKANTIWELHNMLIINNLYTFINRDNITEIIVKHVSFCLISP